MNLHSDYPYWMIKTGLIRSFPALDKNLKTDVLVVGGGITAALVGQKLSASGVSVTVVDKGHIGHGSTSASTAILQYEIDEPLFRLKDKAGKQRAEHSYILCQDSIDKIGELALKTTDKSDFEYHPSLYFAESKKNYKELLLPEFEARKQLGLDVELLDEKEVHDRFGFASPGAIRSAKAAHINPYKLCHHLFEEMTDAGHQVFSHTEIKSWRRSGKGYDVKLKNELNIQAKYIIIACGFESQHFLDKKVSDFDSTYAMVSLPVKDKVLWEDNAILWNTGDPYLYVRTTADNRIIIGGRDDEFSSAIKRDKAVKRKQKELLKDFNKLFPRIKFEVDFAWAGTFAKTKDSLPYIGPYKEPGVFYAMGYGGNGITFSQIASEILTDLITKKKSKDAWLFAFDR
ncbi:MAG: FAD-dependent oxidoreductase [Bacteroidota bacterium]